MGKDYDIGIIPPGYTGKDYDIGVRVGEGL